MAMVCGVEDKNELKDMARNFFTKFYSAEEEPNFSLLVKENGAKIRSNDAVELSHAFTVDEIQQAKL